ncbi:MAG: hypothetical protein M3301_04530 [Chloroflexota bacterium]|nr:hypothetical protein [Chloroflexota bacterium]
MRIVIGTQGLATPAGTEKYVCLVARELQLLGHATVIAAEELGPMADHAESQALVVVRTAADLPAGCDAILANDASSAAMLAARYPSARLVHVAHSDVFDHQAPVLVPGVTDAVVACSDRMAARMEALALNAPVVRLRLPVVLDRLLGTGPLPDRPRRAVIVSNYLAGDRRRALVDAWQARGVTCAQIGVPTQPLLDPGPAMRDADIVVAKAGAALEGMAAERAVYVYDQFGGDGWVTPENYEAFEADNLAGLASPRPRTPAQIAADLDAYHPDMGWLNGELVRAHHEPRKHARQLVELLRGPHAGGDVPASVLSEVARLTRVAWSANRSALAIQLELAALRERALAAESELPALRKRIDAAESEVTVWRERLATAEAQLAESARVQAELGSVRRELRTANELLATSRVRTGLAAGRVLDRLRRPRH